MNPPRYFEEELKNIDKDFFAIFNPVIERWQIRKWIQPFMRKEKPLFSDCIKKSIVIMTVCEYDEDHKDSGYKPLDRRTLHALKVARKNAENPEQVLREIDEWNRKLEEGFDEEAKAMAKDAATSAWNHFHKQIFDYGRKL